MLEHLLFDNRKGRQRTALVGRHLSLLLTQALHHEIQTLGQLALQHDTIVHDGSHAVEELTGAAELARLRPRLACQQ